jgi:hypothetical protein
MLNLSRRVNFQGPTEFKGNHKKKAISLTRWPFLLLYAGKAGPDWGILRCFQGFGKMLGEPWPSK